LSSPIGIGECHQNPGDDVELEESTNRPRLAAGAVSAMYMGPMTEAADGQSADEAEPHEADQFRATRTQAR
jgi:hypothetical protein